MRFCARGPVWSLLLCGVSAPALAQQVGPQPVTPTAVQQAATQTPEEQPKDTIDATDTAVPAADQSAVAAPGTDIIVTGSRSARAVDRVAGAVTVIGSADVKRNLTLTEDATSILARTVPGYSESNQSLNTLGETLRGRTALYLFDGVPQSTPLRDGNRNATFTDMATIERIEVISGASAAEGIGAAGGIINYISKKATQEGTHFGVDARIGSQFRDDSQVYKIGGTVAHKAGGFDFFAAASYLDRGITYDANGRRIGISASSSVADTTQVSTFAKVGYDFGDSDSQRLELTGNYFKLKSKGDYHYVAGSRALGIPDTSEPGKLISATGQILFSPDFNDFKQVALNYSNKSLFGGTLVATGYWARQAMRFPGDNGPDRQDPAIAPLGTLFDQTEILSKKYGLRTSYTLPEFLKGLEVRVGVDATHDATSQRLAQTNRTFVPPLNYNSVGPYVQGSYDIGPFTLSGGFRHEAGTVKVDDYTTIYIYNRTPVTGGKLKFKNDLFNAGGIVRLGGGLTAFATYGEGFTLPNLGTILRSVTRPGQSVGTLIDTEAVVFKNKEIGANLRRGFGSLGLSYYVSTSELGSSLTVDPVTRNFVVNRRPIRINGVDATAELRPTSTLRLNALYSHVIGKTTAANNVTTPLNTRLGVLNISPDKLNGTITWQPVDAGSLAFGATKLFSRDINIGMPTEEHTKGYTLFDATANYRISPVGQFSLGVENLFNKQYFLSSSQIDIFQNYFAGRGRTVTLTYHGNF